MKNIDVLTPASPAITPDELAQKLQVMRQAKRPAPFASKLMKLTEQFSRRLLEDREARGWPELQVLGFWLRNAALEAMKKDFTQKPETISVPQGIVFHIPPANVDTMFAYSLFMSLLCGNANVIRMPSRRGGAMTLLLRILDEVFSGAVAPKDQLLIIGYEHDDEITEIISKSADLRVIWGGDKTVDTIRQIPLSPWGRELVFPDRFSWSAFDVAAYRTLNDMAKDKLAEQYFNDLFWFDQAGCASPRVVLWRGAVTTSITDDFYKRVANVVEDKRWKLDVGINAMKQTRNYGAMADYSITAKRDFGPALTIFSMKDLGDLKAIRDTPCFGGTLFEISIRDLSDIVPHIEKRDQTLTHFGFEKTELESFVHALNEHSFDRLVPIGQALSFNAVWDGYDLLQNFTRLVTIQR